MKKLLLIVFLILLLPVGAGAADAYYYVRTTAAGSEDGSSFANAWAIADIDWSAINTKLATDDVYVYFKRGDTFGQMSILEFGTYVPAATQRLYITVDPVDTGDKPHFSFATSGTWAYGIRWKNAGYITLDNLNIEDTGTATASEAIHTGTDDGGSTANLNNKGYIHITNCDFSGWSHFAIILMNGGNHCVITGNTFDDCGNAIYFGDEAGQGGSYHYIANNTATNIIGYAGTDGHLAGLQRINHSIIENNTGTDVRGPIVLWVGSCSYTAEHNVIRNNTSKTADYTGITIEGNNGAGCTSVNANLVYGNMISGASNTVVRPAIRLNAVKGANGNRVFNNTVYNAQNWGLQNRRGTDYTYWKNNIVHLSGRDGTYDKLFFSAPEGYTQGSNNEIDYNLYWTVEGDPSSYSDWVNYNGSSYSWSTWKSTASHDTNSPLPANPLMTDPENQDYTLQSGSPAIDAGGYLTNVAEAAGSHTVITVSDIYWLHSDMGITDADGNAVEGMLITFYDTTNGLQNREITDIDYGTSEITVAATDIIYNAGALTNPALTTQIALRFSGVAPDIGAHEYVDPSGDPPINNDCSLAIAHYILDADGEDSTANDNDATLEGDPSFVSNGLVLNGTDQWGHVAALSHDISDFTIFANIKPTGTLGDSVAYPVCGEYDIDDGAGGSEKNFLLTIADIAGGGDGPDVVRGFVGFNSGDDAEGLDSTHDLSAFHAAGTPYSICLTWDATNKDMHIYIHTIGEAAAIQNGATGETGDLLAGETQNVEATAFTVGTFYDDGVPAVNKLFKGGIYEVALYASEKSQADALAFAKSEYADSSAISVQGMSSACGNLTAAGTMTWAIGWDRQPYTDGGVWTITATFDYPVAAQTMSYTGKWNDEIGWTQVGETDVWWKTTYIEPTSVKADTNVLAEDDGDFESLDADEWDWVDWDGATPPKLYVNVGSDPSDDVITPSPWETYVALAPLGGCWEQNSFGDAEISANITLPDGIPITDAQDTAAVIEGALTALESYPANTVDINCPLQKHIGPNGMDPFF